MLRRPRASPPPAPGAAGEVASAQPGSWTKFVNSGGRGRARRRASERRGEEGEGARAARSTHRRRRRVRRRRRARAQRGQQTGTRHGVGTGAGPGAGAVQTRGLASFSWTGINQAARHLPPGHVLRPGPPEADSGRGSGDWGGAGRNRVSGAASVRATPCIPQGAR